MLDEEQKLDGELDEELEGAPSEEDLEDEDEGFDDDDTFGSDE